MSGHSDGKAKLAEVAKPEFRFRIWHLFFVTALFASGLAVHPSTLVLTKASLGFCLLANKHKRVPGILV